MIYPNDIIVPVTHVFTQMADHVRQTLDII